MNQPRFLLLLTALFLSATLSINAGELTPELASSISTARADSLVPVWIKLHSERQQARLAATVADVSLDRAERYQSAAGVLKSENAASQESLIDYLEELKATFRADNIHGRWIANIIEADIALSEIEKIALRSDVEIISHKLRVELIEPEILAEQPALSTSVTANLTYIRAPQAWGMGYTGAGRVVCSFDTGVQGSHTGLANNWKGKDGDSTAAWFDPLQDTKFPHTFSTGGVSFWHGTHTMGTMVGIAPETTGVAPAAKWISAAVIDIPGASILEAFEWAANPDGNPNTVDDVPDVINHSWGYADIGCLDAFFEAVENTEALGIVNIFAAGNEGSTPNAIRNPATRALDSLDMFAVGNLNATVSPAVVSGSSSRGPSECVGGGIKPNVVAPGQSVRSTYPTNQIQPGTGTSMAAPHVSGLVALLRQKNPNATVREIKLAILNSTVRTGLGAIPNNIAGWGSIDCVNALNALSSTGIDANIRVYDFPHQPIDPGDIIAGKVILQNLGANAANVNLTITGSNPFLTVQDGSASFGTIIRNDTVTSSDNIQVTVSPIVPVGALVSLDVLITGTGFTQTAKLFFLVEPKSRRSMATHTPGRIEFTVSNYGVYGLGPGSLFPAGGSGFKFDGSGNHLYEAGLMIGTGPTKVSSGVHEFIFEPELDFVVAPGGNIVYESPGDAALQQTYSKFTDDSAKTPIGLEITQESFVRSGPNNDFVIIRFIIRNKTASVLNGLRVGLFLDWDAVGFADNAGGYDDTSNFLWTAHNTGGLLSDFRGVKAIDATLSSAFTARADLLVYTPANNGDGFTMAEKYTSLTNGVATANTFKASLFDLCQVLAVGPLSLAAGASDTVAFALLAGETFAEITAAANKASSVPTDVEEPGEELLPGSYSLHQNYPNPFNPSTTISFEMPSASDYELTIYNTLGQAVKKFDGQGKAGRVDIEWNAGSFASGLYLYTLHVGDFAASRKMLLLK